MDNLCGSVAASCVVTYVLGIGDRHLENICLTPSGWGRCWSRGSKEKGQKGATGSHSNVREFELATAGFQDVSSNYLTLNLKNYKELLGTCCVVRQAIFSTSILASSWEMILNLSRHQCGSRHRLLKP